MPGSQGICWKGLQATPCQEELHARFRGAYVDEYLNLVSAGYAWLQSKG